MITQNVSLENYLDTVSNVTKEMTQELEEGRQLK